jgi:hypothetical protein
MFWDIQHFLLVDITPVPQIFILGKSKNKYQWMGLRVVHMMDDDWLPFAHVYNEGYPVVDFRYFFMPVDWRREFFTALFTKKVPDAFQDIFWIFEDYSDITDALEEIYNKRKDPFYSGAIYKTFLLLSYVHQTTTDPVQSTPLSDLTLELGDAMFEKVRAINKWKAT